MYARAQSPGFQGMVEAKEAGERAAHHARLDA
jgi:hypothetical protein